MGKVIHYILPVREDMDQQQGVRVQCGDVPFHAQARGQDISPGLFGGGKGGKKAWISYYNWY